jgi:hypothetical protein
MDVIYLFLNILLITMLGLLIAFSPMLVLVNVLVVLKSQRPILRTTVLMAGMALPLIVIALLAAMFLEPTSEISLRGLSEKISIPPIFDLLLGLWLVSLAAKRWRYTKIHGTPKKTSTLISKKPPDKLSELFMFAFFKSILSVTNIFAILALANYLTVHSIPQPFATLAVIWVILIGLVPFLIILYYYFFKHDMLDILDKQVDKLLSRNIDFAITIGLLAAGIFFALHSVGGLIR